VHSSDSIQSYLSSFKDKDIGSTVFLVRGDVTDTRMPMLVIIPIDEAGKAFSS